MSALAHIKNILEKDHNKENRDVIVKYIGDNKDRFKALMDVFLDQNLHWRYNQRAAWPLGVIGRKNPNLITPYFGALVEAMDNPRHDAVLRNIVRIFEDFEIPEEFEGEVYEKCFAFLNTPEYPIAVRCFSLTVLFNIAKKYEGLQTELVEAIKIHLPYGSAGFKNRAGKILSVLDK